MMTEYAVDPRAFAAEDDARLPDDAPRIGVVVSLCFPGMDEESLELMTRFTATAFAEIRAAGGRPVLIDSAAAEKPNPRGIAASYDALLFLGGGDVDGELYGKPSLAENAYGVDRAADDFCLAVMRESLESDQTLLAVCRGSQLLNVACGGTLVPDLVPSDLHRGGPGQPMFLDEEVLLEPGTRIAEIYGGRRQLLVRSGHHQAVDQVGAGLRVTARALDGVIEGTEHTEKRWVVGVQWHPEDDAGNAESRAALFRAFVAEVSSRVALV